MSRIKDLRMKLTDEQIKNTLAKLGVFPHEEAEKAIIYPTVCHNEHGGSPKLYYYRDEKMFKCYTQCNSMFDIFDLIQRIKRNRGEHATLPQAIALTGVEDNNDIDPEILEDLKYLRRLSESQNELVIDDENAELKILDKNILNSFKFNRDGIKPWIDEGISEETLNRFNIKYDSYLNAIVIPNFNHEGELIGIRGRFLGENAYAKYMPLKFKGEILSHPTGKFFYGYYENKSTIKAKRMAVIFEGEKSVLKMDTYYPESNIALSTSGKKITFDHLGALLKLNVREVVLAYDRDYQNPQEREEKIKEYAKIVAILKPYFEVSIIIDYNNKLQYKDSPIDQGKEVFNQLMKERLKR